MSQYVHGMQVNFHQFELGREDEEQGKGSAIDHKISDTQPGEFQGHTCPSSPPSFLSLNLKKVTI